jgi:hypothetical protein
MAAIGLPNYLPAQVVLVGLGELEVLVASAVWVE